jgi:hypothetical protein
MQPLKQPRRREDGHRDERKEKRIGRYPIEPAIAAKIRTALALPRNRGIKSEVADELNMKPNVLSYHIGNGSSDVMDLISRKISQRLRDEARMSKRVDSDDNSASSEPDTD